MKARLPLVRADGSPAISTGSAELRRGPPVLRLVPPLPIVCIVSAVPALALRFATTLLGASLTSGAPRALLLREASRALELGASPWPTVEAVAEVLEMDLESLPEVALRALEARPKSRLALGLGGAWHAHFAALLTVQVGASAASREWGLGAVAPEVDLQVTAAGVDTVASALGRWLGETLAGGSQPVVPRS